MAGLPGRRRDRRAAPEPVAAASGSYDVDLAMRARRRRAAGPRGRRAAADGHRPDRDGLRAARPVRGALGRADPRGGRSRRDEQRYRIAERLRRLNELGFDVDEVELITDDGGASGSGSRPASPSPGSTGASSSGSPASRWGRTRPAACSTTCAASAPGSSSATAVPVPETVAGHRWVSEVYQPIVDAIPADLAGRLAPAGGVPRGPRAPVVPVRGGRHATWGRRPRPLLLRDRAAADAGRDDHPLGARRGRRSGGRQLVLSGSGNGAATVLISV